MPEKLRIGVILQGSAAWMGGAEYSRNLIKAMYRLPDAIQNSFELRILAEEQVEASLYADMPERFFRELHQDLKTKPEPMWIRAGRRLMPRGFAHGPALVRHAWRLGVRFLYPFNRPAVDYGQIRSAAWIPDLQHRTLPDFFSKRERSIRDEEFRDQTRCADAVVVSSNAAAADLAQYFPEAADKACVLRFCTVADDAWLRPDPSTIVRKYGLPARYFMVCNQFWKHKNHRVVFTALGILKKEGITPALVCTGKLEDYRHPEFQDEVMRMIEAENIGAQVHLLGLLPRVDQVQLMRAALAVIQPSLFEGWNTVVEDCHALGKRLIVSDIAVHREQDPPDATYFSAQDAERLAEILREGWRDLPMGPETGKEQTALALNRANVQAFGNRFLALAHSVHGINSPLSPCVSCGIIHLQRTSNHLSPAPLPLNTGGVGGEGL